MIVALIDNGSLEPAAHRNLRQVAEALADRVGYGVYAVSWKHSDRIRPDALGGEPAWTLDPWLREQYARGERHFLFVPFFISPQGAIGSALGRDLKALQASLGGFRFAFTPGLAASGTLSQIVADRIEQTITQNKLVQPAVVLVDHGGPSPASAILRNEVAAAVRDILGGAIGSLVASSMEGEAYNHNLPLFADVLSDPKFSHGDVVVARLFLAPGRHAGPHGDLAQIVEAAEDRMGTPLHCHFTELVGTHPDVVPTLADALNRTVPSFHAAA